MVAFPVPDFSFEEDNDEPCPVLCSPLRCKLHSLTDDEAHMLITRSGLMISSREPLRCTSTSAVYEAKSVSDGNRWAVKISSNGRRLQDEYLKRCFLPDSPYLVKTFELHEISKKNVLVMEFCLDGDLGHLRLAESDIWHLINDIAHGLNIIHAAGWIHLDVSPGNILKTALNFKLADFATLTKIGEFREGGEGAGPYVSPEALAYPFGPHPITGQTDIFSFGIALLETITGQLAPRGGTEAYTKLRQGAIRMPVHPYRGCSQELVSLVNSMIEPDPANRPTACGLVRLSELYL
jgi:membrane-associated tyrosine/threonine-specific cdc2-inhibitory kinase